MMTTLLQSAPWLSLHGLIVVIGLFIYVLTTHSLQQRRSPTAAISWVLTIALLPYLGLPLYLLFGTRKLMHSRGRILAGAPETGLNSAATWPQQLAASMGQPAIASYRNLRIHADGREAGECLWELIESARRELILCTFILGRDSIGKALLERLIVKARAGVTIRLLVDDVGHFIGGGISLHKLKAAGLQVALSGPILHKPFSGTTNMRNHRKMVVADGARLWCGGRNFAVEYFEGAHRRSPWRDLTFDLQGPLAAQARELFERDWASAIGAPRENRPLLSQNEPGPFAQLIASGPDQSDDTVHDLLLTACFKAQTRIIAATPYFVPGEALLKALSLAARRGVTVDLILPRRSNHPMADFSRHRALRDLASAGGRVWLVPYMLHAKAIVFDDNLALAGSANLDSRSLFLNYEMMVAFYAFADVRRFASFLEGHREKADQYEIRKPGLARDLAEGMVLWLAFQL